MKSAVTGFNLENSRRLFHEGLTAVPDDEAVDVRERAVALGRQLFKNRKEATVFADKLISVYVQSRDKEILIIHNPGGWGHSDLGHLIGWEANLLDRIKQVVDESGKNWLLLQYLRGGPRFWHHVVDFFRLVKFTFTGKLNRARILAREIDFLTFHLKNLNVVLVGVSQGAAFANGVMRELRSKKQVYSIELGIFFGQLRWRVVSDNTLAIDSNGLAPDSVVDMKWSVAIAAYVKAPFIWLKNRLLGRHVTFAVCINMPGHEYHWDNPGIGQKITEFISENF